MCSKCKIKGTELNIAIFVMLLSSVLFMTIINPVPFIASKKFEKNIKKMLAIFYFL